MKRNGHDSQLIRGAIGLLLGCWMGVAVQAEAEILTTPPPSNDTELWVMAGQSNMVGCGRHVRKLEPDPRIWLYNMDNTWIPAVPPLHRIFESVAPVHREIFWKTDQITEEDFLERGERSKRSPAGGVGLGYFFAKRLIEGIDSEVGLIASAHGGTTMEQWDPKKLSEGDHSLYGATINRIKAVGGKVRGILWYQGESEAMEPGQEKVYEAEFLELIDSFRRDTGDEDLPFILVQIGRWARAKDPRADNWDTVRDIQRRVATQRENVWVTSAIDLELDDQIHLSMAGHERLGARMAEIALGQVYGIENRAVPIDLKSVEVEKADSNRPVIRVHFDGVDGKLVSQGPATGFRIRTDRAGESVPQPCRVDFDPDHPSTAILRFGYSLTLPATLIYGKGLDPYVNIVDEKDMPVPAFSYEMNQ